MQQSLDDAADRGRGAGRRRRHALRDGSIAGGMFLIGVGMLTLTNWWWPGIMLVIGLAGAAELIRQRRATAAISTFVGFTAMPLAIALLNAIAIPWLPVGALLLIGLGLLSLARAGAQNHGGAR